MFIHNYSGLAVVYRSSVNLRLVEECVFSNFLIFIFFFYTVPFLSILQLTLGPIILLISVSITAVQMKAIVVFSSVHCTEASQNNVGCRFIHSLPSHGSHFAKCSEPVITISSPFFC